ncbi:hypothetical protein M514_02407 [Trichuris suis]|uniref:Uncharacterized protein n=1 Tax=Trichuris suis TaxID=68888 RepID=A0A085N5S1_9BILA|nr:hypothetical protein M514_02407 [Trichuris suis]
MPHLGHRVEVHRKVGSAGPRVSVLVKIKLHAMREADYTTPLVLRSSQSAPRNWPIRIEDASAPKRSQGALTTLTLRNTGLEDKEVSPVIHCGEQDPVERKARKEKIPLDSMQSTASIPKANIHGKSMLFCIQWNHEGILQLELMQPLLQAAYKIVTVL